MRELKFRAWDKAQKKYIIPQRLALDDDGALDFYVYNRGGYALKCFIIEQYTGLKDKNGKEIYEGDIVKARWYRAKNARLDTEGEIKFGDGWFYIKDDPDEQDRLGVPIHNCYDIKIVGNIHEREEEE